MERIKRLGFSFGLQSSVLSHHSWTFVLVGEADANPPNHDGLTTDDRLLKTEDRSLTTEG